MTVWLTAGDTTGITHFSSFKTSFHLLNVTLVSNSFFSVTTLLGSAV